MHYNFYVYMLGCADGHYYIGVTDDLEKRLWQNETVFFPKCYTATRRPLQLLYAEHYTHIEQAKAREQQLKGWTRAKKEALMQQDWTTLKTLAKNYTERFGAEPECSGEPVEPRG